MPASPTETRVSLILRLQDMADVEAWDEFVELYTPVIQRVAKQRGMQPADADNLVQQVMLKVAQSISAWLDREDRGPFRAWLVRIARNESIDLLTRRTTKGLGVTGDEANAAWENAKQADQIATFIDREYEQAVFDWAAQQVRQTVQPQTWLAFWLTHVDGLSVQQAAERLNVRTANIYFGRSRVMLRLRELIQQYED
ncbi:RNA polymerase sigma factor [Roseimaritima sediminicola]|uniref:RNA polymerase sigma factor n=1 Tax=Roseimaritima sediminicola TaxID=2662066 RepID=UPI0013873CC6|nr:sigma-70 family RNA polymerase sigma factor [Roseimaritima sediminicola]